MTKPKQTQIMGVAADWPPAVYELWDKHVAPLFGKDRHGNQETCSKANYFHPRPRRDEYDHSWDGHGFTYIVQPGNHICQAKLVDVTPAIKVS